MVEKPETKYDDIIYFKTKGYSYHSHEKIPFKEPR